MTIISTIFTVLTVITGGACVLLLVSTKTLRDSRDDQEKRIKFLEEERTRDKDTITAQATELGIWRSAVTGEKQLAAIMGLLTRHHTEAKASWIEVGDTLRHVDEILSHLDATIARVVGLLESVERKSQ
jgi:hypothetical protein